MLDDLRARAEAAMATLEYENAVALWAEIRNQIPNDLQAHTRAVVALRKLGKLDEADTLIEGALSNLPLRS